MRTRLSFWPALIFGVAVIPAGLIVWLVLRYAVAVPMLDDWEMVPVVTKAHTGSLTFADLFEQQQESRTFFPRLIFIALSFGKYWDSRVEMMLGILLCCLSLLGIHRLSIRSALPPATVFVATFLSALLIFSPAQHELWLLASGFPSFVPALCIIGGLLAGRSGLSVAAKFWICAGLSFLASFTLSNGLLAWGLTFPIFLLSAREPGWKRWLGFWTLATAICAAIYFWKFRAPLELPPFAPRRSLLDYCAYITAFLGAGLGRAGNENPLAVSIGVGIVLCVGYLAAFWSLIRRWWDCDYRCRLAPWLALGAYSIGSALLAALGRIEWGVGQALESRYVAFSLYLAVAVIAAGSIFASDLLRANRAGPNRLATFAATIFIGAACFTLELLCAGGSLSFFALRSAAARLGQSAILFGQVLDTSSTIENVNHPRPFFVRSNANALDCLHLLRTPLFRTLDVTKLRHTEVSDGIAAGWCDGLAAETERVTAWGWAALLERRRPADAVVLAYANAEGSWVVFALSDAVIQRPDVAASLGHREQLWSGWRVVFARHALPEGAEISAWAVDAKEAKLYRLKTKGRLFNL